MKLFLRRTDKEELIFIPSYLLVNNFEKLLRKKDHQYKRMILHFLIEFLLIDKKKRPKGFDINFSDIEEKARQSFNKSNKYFLVKYNFSTVELNSEISIGYFSLA